VTVGAETTEGEGMPIVSRQLRVTLVSNATLEGRLDFVPIQGRARVTDVLYEPVSSFCLHHGESISYVVKAHVLFVEEQG
jgi:hypothetical protein